jgi:hypothetical protein
MEPGTSTILDSKIGLYSVVDFILLQLISPRRASKAELVLAKLMSSG